MAGIELHDEIVEWMASLDTTEWDRTVIIDRLADLGSMARMPFSEALGDGLFVLRFTLGPPHGESPTDSPRTTRSSC